MIRMTSIDDHIEQHSKEIDKYTRYYIRINKPFEYMFNLAKYAEKNYRVNGAWCFQKAVDNSLDLYNRFAEPHSHEEKVQSLIYGAEMVLRYVHKEINCKK